MKMPLKVDLKVLIKGYRILATGYREIPEN
jgi:hypothetical protein